jgi:hypothetical protein
VLLHESDTNNCPPLKTRLVGARVAGHDPREHKSCVCSGRCDCVFQPAVSPTELEIFYSSGIEIKCGVNTLGGC